MLVRQVYIKIIYLILKFLLLIHNIVRDSVAILHRIRHETLDKNHHHILLHHICTNVWIQDGGLVRHNSSLLYMFSLLAFLFLLHYNQNQDQLMDNFCAKEMIVFYFISAIFLKMFSKPVAYSLFSAMFKIFLSVMFSKDFWPFETMH
jgi:hypothetical protein